MELTGKCKEDFINFMCKTYPDIRWHEYENLPNSILNALIIEFFDSVGIYIDTWEYEGFCWQVYSNLVNESPKYNEPLKSRPEAQTEAIKKANQIYNELC